MSHEDFDPVWSEAERLRLPVCVHTGWCHPGLKRPFTDSYGAHVLGFTLPVMMGFYAFLGGGILDRFPRLKVAFLEAGADWVPYLIERMDHYFHSESANGRPVPKRRASEYIRDCEVYFTCEAEEKLVPQVIEFVGEDRIMISADMPHGEAREGSVQEIRERADLSGFATWTWTRTGSLPPGLAPLVQLTVHGSEGSEASESTPLPAPR